MNEITQRIAAIVKRAQAFGGMEALDAEGLAETITEELAFELETQTNVPVAVPLFDKDGEPIMCDCGEQKQGFDWANRQRWVLGWEETSRITSAEMQARCDANMAKVAARLGIELEEIDD